MTVSHGLVSRNLLRNKFFELIKERSDVRLVILTPAAGNAEFEREFCSDNVVVEKMLCNRSRPYRERLINFLHASAVFTGTSKVKFQTRIGRDRFIGLRMLLRQVSAFLLGRSVLYRKAIRLLDRAILPDERNVALLKKYRPSLVFCTSIIMPDEIDIVKAAKKENVRVIGMVKSWDNLVKDIPLRMPPDVLLVWNEVMKSQAIRYQLMQRNKIEMVGIPQFDIYEEVARRGKLTRDQFMLAIGADPNKKLIVFASEGKWSPGDPEIVKIITRFIKKGLLKEDCHLHVRPHFCWASYLEPLFQLEEEGVVTVDKEWNKTNAFPEKWDPSDKDTMHLAHSMKFADVVITSPSTIVLDAIYFDKPVISIGFDGVEQREYAHSVRMLYETEYYKKVMEFEATDYVTNQDQLLWSINKILRNGGEDRVEKRAILRNEFCAYRDGRSGERIAKFILETL